MRPHVATVYRWELRKLLAQKRTYLGLAFAGGMPLIFVTVVAIRNQGPQDVPFGRYVYRLARPRLVRAYRDTRGAPGRDP